MQWFSEKSVQINSKAQQVHKCSLILNFCDITVLLFNTSFSEMCHLDQTRRFYIVEFFNFTVGQVLFLV